MKLNLDKNLIGNIVILASLILLLVCIAMEVNLMVDSTINAGQPVEWNGVLFSPSPDVEVEVTADTLRFDSPYDSHDVELKKTKDQSNFNQYIGGDNIFDCWQTPYNETHTLIVNDGKNFAVIIANDDFDDADGPVVLKGNPDLVEVTFSDSQFLISAINPVVM